MLESSPYPRVPAHVRKIVVAQDEFFYCPDEHPAGPTKTYVVLDANVLQAVTSMAYNGYKRENIEHLRVANMLRWLQRSPCFAVSESLAIFEGAGLHSGQPNPFEMVRRGLYFRGLWSLNAEELESWLTVGGAAIAYAEPNQFEESMTFAYEKTYGSLPWMLGPNYLAVLQMHVNDLHGLAPRDGLVAIRDMFLDLNFVSSQAWMTAVLHYYGARDIPNFIRTGLLKLQRADRRTPIISAAMDLTYLSHLSQLKHEFRTPCPELHTIFITADRALCRLHSLIGFGPGCTYLSEADLDPKTLDESSAVSDSLIFARSFASPQKPSISDIERLARPLEERLGIEPLSWAGLYDPDEHVADPNLQAELVNLYGLSGVDLWVKVCDLSREGDVLFEGLQLAHSMLHGIADKTGRDPDRLADSVANSVRQEFDLPILSMGERLCVAFAKGHSWSGNALLQQVGTFDKDTQPQCALYVVAYISAIIELMADLTQLDPQVVADRQKAWLERRGPSNR